MPNNELWKILVFIFLQTITCILFIGIIPTTILLVGYLMMKRTKESGAFIKAIELCLTYTTLVASISVISLIYLIFTDQYFKIDEFFIGITWTVLLWGIYSTLLSKLLLDPVQKYASEVTEFGVFGYKKDVGNKKSSVNLDSILLADELIKLKTLRDDAVITTEEFNELKKKLLDR